MRVVTCIGWVLRVFAVLAMAGSLWAASLLVCPKCGTEAAEDATTCSHCGAAMPRRTAPTAPSNTPAKVEAVRIDAVSALAMDAIRIDLRLAAECREGIPQRAFAFYENALALSRLVRRDAVTAETGKSLADELGRCREGLMRGTRSCPTCGGSGKRVAQFQSLLGNKSATVVQTVDGAVCPVCKGKGTVQTRRSADDVRILIGQGRKDFETRQTALGRVAVGRVWVPAEMFSKLDVRSQALLRTACPTPCSECMGSGVQNCSRCRGAARIACNANGCQDGMVVRKESNTLSAKGTIARREPCPVCHGTRFQACPDCLGEGTTPCRLCRGTGRNVPCQDCGGQGWSLCATCHGTGKQINGTPCSECRGHPERLCPKCHGEGCAAR